MALSAFRLLIKGINVNGDNKDDNNDGNDIVALRNPSPKGLATGERTSHEISLFCESCLIISARMNLHFRSRNTSGGKVWKHDAKYLYKYLPCVFLIDHHSSDGTVVEA